MFYTHTLTHTHAHTPYETVLTRPHSDSPPTRHPPATTAADEIDTIGRARGASFGADNDEREQGLLQLLVEMDGFDTKDEQVLVIGATNLRSTLDPALLRAGRFDRVVHLGLPAEPDRLKILQVRDEELWDWDCEREPFHSMRHEHTHAQKAQPHSTNSVTSR